MKPIALIALMCLVVIGSAPWIGVSSASEWNLNVVVAPDSFAPSRTIAFYVTATNAGAGQVYLFNVSVVFGWDPNPKILFDNSYDSGFIGAGESLHLGISQGVPDLAPGTYNWTVVVLGFVVDNPGYAIHEYEGTFLVEGDASPVAAFSYSPSAPLTNASVQFTDRSWDQNGTIVAWYWDFDDGNVSTFQSPTHAFSEAGLYNVSLTITEGNGVTSTVVRGIRVEVPQTPVDLMGASLWPWLGGILAISAAVIAILMLRARRAHRTVPRGGSGPKRGP